MTKQVDVVYNNNKFTVVFIGIMPDKILMPAAGYTVTDCDMLSDSDRKSIIFLAQQKLTS